MKKFTVSNTASSTVLGTFAAQSEEDALDAMARDASYQDYAALQAEFPAEDGEIVVTEVKTVSFTFDVDTGKLGDSAFWHPFISLELYEDGECKVYVSDYQTQPEIDHEAIFTAVSTMNLCKIKADEDRVKRVIKRFEGDLNAALTEYEGEGKIDDQMLKEKIEDAMSNWVEWAADVSEDEEAA